MFQTIVIIIAILMIILSARKILQLLNEKEIVSVNPHEIDLVGETEVLEKIRKNRIDGLSDKP